MSANQYRPVLYTITSNNKQASYLSGGGGQNWPDGIRDSKTNEQQIRTRGISDLLPSQGQGDPKIAAARNRPVMSRTSTAPDCPSRPKGQPKGSPRLHRPRSRSEKKKKKQRKKQDWHDAPTVPQCSSTGSATRRGPPDHHPDPGHHNVAQRRLLLLPPNKAPY
jgi:ribosomal protein L32